MAEKLDPTDNSKLFGEKLNELLNVVVEFEANDFADQMADSAYEDVTAEEHDLLFRWVKNREELEAQVSNELLAKCPHQFATAVLLLRLLEEGE